MKVGLFITGRLKSTRLPLKLLLPLKGQSVINHIIIRAKEINNIEQIVLCTSYHPQDLALVKEAHKHNIYYFMGNPDDVLHRLYQAATFYHIDYILSVTADDPFYSIEYANKMANEAILHKPDYMYTEGLPIGIGIYGIRYEALKTIIEFKNQVDTEIWGAWFNQPTHFDVHVLQAQKEHQRDVRLTLDTYEDYLFLQRIAERLPRDEFMNYQSLLQVIEQIPKETYENKNVMQKALPDSTLNEIKKLFQERYDEFKKIKKQNYKK